MPEELSPLEMSDEKFDEINLEDIEPKVEEEETVNETSSTESEGSDKEAVQGEEALEVDKETEDREEGVEVDSVDSTDTSATEDDGSTEIEEVSSEEDEAIEETDESSDISETKSTDTGESTDEQVVDYKAEYEKLMMPFKANGTEMQAKSVEDAVQLMQMGAGYHKKMAALKPAIRQMKLLEKNNLLDDDKLNYLIDLSNKNPEAIQKLLKDSNIDPLDIDVNAETAYKPTERKITDTEIAIDEVINDIRDTPTFKRTLNVVSDLWDESSQNAIASEPQIIKTINGHMQDGTYDAVIKRVDYERSLGRLQGISDIQAYMTMGNVMADEGALYRSGTTKPVKQPISVPPIKKQVSKKDIERQKRKIAASPTKTAKTPATTFKSPLEMTEEEFAKIDINKFKDI
jgi:hypothetical protein